MITLIIPYYNQSAMLQRQLQEIEQYPDYMKVIVVDDGSKDAAEPYVKASKANVELYRIIPDIPWNRSQARNLGAYVAQTDWIIQVDTDHVLPVKCAEQLSTFLLNSESWFRFPRYRIGKADDTRRKDNLPADADKGRIHPHQDSYLIRRDWFLDSPYDERYSGCLGGGTPFLERMKRLHGEPKLLPDSVYLEVYTKHKIQDASVTELSRDTTEYARRRDTIGANDRPVKMLMHPWYRVC